jgi:hypothetical protein
MFSGIQDGSRMISGGITGRSSQSHRPNSASQMRVNTRLRSTPPAPRTQAAVLRMCSASSGSPARRSAT